MEVNDALRQSEERFRKVFEEGPLGMALIGHDQVPIKVNKRLCHMLGFTESELLGLSFSSITHPEDISASDQLSRILERGVIPYFTVEKRLYRKDQSLIWTQWTGSLVPDLHEKQSYGLAMIQEITERKRAETALSQYAERLEALHRIDQAILAAQSPQKIAEVALQHLKHQVKCSRVSVQEYEPESGLLRLLAHLSDPPTEREAGVAMPLDPKHQELLRKGQTVVITLSESSSPSGPLESQLQREGIGCYLCVPLLLQDDLVGVLELGARDEQCFTRDHLAIVEEIATMMTVSLRHARLNERTRRDAQTKAILLHEVNHRVKNNLTAIIGLLYAHQRLARNQNLPLTWEVMKDLINGIQGLATAHSLLSESEWEPLLLETLASQVIHACFKALPPGKSAAISITRSPVRVPAAQANSVAMILAELAMNTLKYGLRESPQVTVQVQIALENNHIELTYRDDGPGYPEAILDMKQQTVGLYLIKSLVRNDLHGELKLTNNPGAATLIRFKSTHL